MYRIGIRVQDLFDEKILRQKVEGALELKNHLLVKVYNRRAITVDEVVEELLVVRRAAAPDGRRHRAGARRGARRGADRAARGRPGDAARRRPRHLSVRHLVERDRRRRLHRRRHPADPDRPGHRRRQGLRDPGRAGPFPTELLDADGERLRADGAEFGTTTGRPRRCGWYDAVVARYAARVNGVTDFVLTKLDVLTGWERIPVCVGYDVDGVRHDEMPMTQTDFHHAKPVYEFFDGWDEDISGARTLDDLPKTRAGVRRRARGDVRRADLGDRRRARPRPDRRDPLAARLSRAATPPRAAELSNAVVRLRPAALSDADGLFAAIDDERVWAAGYGGGPAARPRDAPAMRAMLEVAVGGPARGAAGVRRPARRRVGARPGRDGRRHEQPR